MSLKPLGNGLSVLFWTSGCRFDKFLYGAKLCQIDTCVAWVKTRF